MHSDMDKTINKICCVWHIIFDVLLMLVMIKRERMVYSRNCITKIDVLVSTALPKVSIASS